MPESVFGTCYEKLAVAVEARGGELLLESTVTALETRDGRIHEVVLRDGRRFQPGHLIWSGNLLALARLLGKEPPPIRYLSTVLYNIEVEGEVLQKQRWIYYGGEDTKFSRVSVTTEMAPYMAPAGRGTPHTRDSLRSRSLEAGGLEIRIHEAVEGLDETPLAQGNDHVACDAHGLRRFDGAPLGNERLGLAADDGVRVRPRLALEDEDVLESPGGHEGGAPALALEDGVRRNGRAVEETAEERRVFPEALVEALDHGLRGIGWVEGTLCVRTRHIPSVQMRSVKVPPTSAAS